MANNSEARPLLTSYDSTKPSHASLKPTGRGKLRFQMRQQLKENARSHGVFKSVFSLKNAHHHNKVGSAIPSKGNEGARKTQSLSIDREQPVDHHGPGEHTPNKHSPLYNMLNPKSSAPSAQLFQKFITFVILVDALIYILSTEPDLDRFSYVFYGAEAVTSTIFAVEYVARLAVCNEKKCCAKYGPVRGRWKYACSSQALIDAFATFPFFIEILSGIPLPTLTYLRVFRVLRITRTRSYGSAMGAVARVLYFNREILHVAALLGMYLVVITSILMYYLRPRGEDIELVDDASDFSSIGKTMVLSIMMLTGQGGPSGSLPWYTQLVVLLTGMFSVAMFAIPASMLTWGFEAEAERLGAKAKKRAMARRRGERYDTQTSSSSSNISDMSGFGDISTSDEEYMNIIGGDDDAESEVVMQKTSSLGEGEGVQSLLNRIEQLEQNVALTNTKLDLILEKLESKQSSSSGGA